MTARARPALFRRPVWRLPPAVRRAIGAGARLALAGVLLALAAREAIAATPAPHPLDDIRAVALAAAGGAGAQGEARLDSRLRMAACSQPLAAVARGPRMVQVRCPDAPGWTLHVPVVLQGASATAAVAAQAAAAPPLAAQPVKRGDPVVLVSRGGPVEVRMPGLAMGAADRVGDRVGVQNGSSGRTVRGRLTAEPGVVEVVF